MRIFYLFCIVMLFSCGRSAAETSDLGRLFTSPTQRRMLEQRISPRAPNGIGASMEPNREIAIGKTVLHIDGYVYRRGYELAWINGKQIHAGQSSSGIRVLGSNQPPWVVLQTEDGRRFALKVGDTFDPVTRTSSGVRVQRD